MLNCHSLQSVGMWTVEAAKKGAADEDGVIHPRGPFRPPDAGKCGGRQHVDEPCPGGGSGARRLFLGGPRETYLGALWKTSLRCLKMCPASGLAVRRGGDGGAA